MKKNKKIGEVNIQNLLQKKKREELCIILLRKLRHLKQDLLIKKGNFFQLMINKIILLKIILKKD